jgi:hypothetical protein
LTQPNTTTPGRLDVAHRAVDGLSARVATRYHHGMPRKDRNALKRFRGRDRGEAH